MLHNILHYICIDVKYRAMRGNRIALVRSVPAVISMTSIIILTIPSGKIINYLRVSGVISDYKILYVHHYSVALSPRGYYKHFHRAPFKYYLTHD